MGALMLSFAFVGTASALTATCSGSPTATNITWTASASDGILPFAFLWGNGSTSTSQTIAVAPGTHSMTLQATDASTTVATTTCAATVASSATSTQGTVSAQIQALLAQIKALQAQIIQLLAQQAGGGSGAATSTPAGCFGFWRDLKHGDNGDDVRELQRELAHIDPTLFPPGLATGFFGSKTEAALKMLQRRFGIDATGTGFFGSKSRSHFAALCSNGDSDKDGTKNADDSDDDNDGTDDSHDAFPFNPNATSTKAKFDDDDKKGSRGKKGENGDGRGNDDDDSDDD